MLNRLDLRGATDVRSLLPRPEAGDEEPVEAVQAIIADVCERGDVALFELTERFDGVALEALRVPDDDIARALADCPADLRAALELAATNIRRFHETQVVADHVQSGDGVTITGRSVPVDRAGLYVPGGRGAYPSTVLMTAIPARVAGVAELVLCVPPDRATGRVAAATLAASAIAEVDAVFAIGGAQAIAAMAYGTASVPAVDVIAGPGNLFVAIAKREVAGHVGVAAAFAGPSEIVVVADASAPPNFAAIDVLVQAEHGPDGMAWCITWDEDVADAVDAAVDRLAAVAPRKAEITSTLTRNGWLALVDGPAQAIEVANLIAPEHLQLMCADAVALAADVRHAGAVFTGIWSPASLGDYVAGPSHVLPTHGSARYAGALTVSDFTKSLHVISYEPEALRAVAGAVALLADTEGFVAHGDSVRLRVAALDDAVTGEAAR